MNAPVNQAIHTGGTPISPRAMIDMDLLSELCASVPSTSLFVPVIDPDKPPVIVIADGGRAVCRYRNDAEGVAYAKLIAAAASSLPLLLNALREDEHSAPDRESASPISASRRSQIEKNIAQILAVQPGFRPATASTFSKLIYAAVEPFVAPETAPAASLDADQSVPLPDSKAAREEAVASFCSFLKGQDDPDSIPSDAALDHYLGEWLAEQA